MIPFPLAQFHAAPMMTMSESRATWPRVLDPGEIPDTRGRHVPKSKLANPVRHADAQQVCTTTESSSSNLKRCHRSTAVAGTPDIITNQLGGAQRSRAVLDVTKSVTSSNQLESISPIKGHSRKRHKSNPLPTFDSDDDQDILMGIDAGLHQEVLPHSLKVTPAVKKKYAKHLATIKTFVSHPDDNRILSLLDFYNGDTNMVVCVLLDEHNISPNISPKRERNNNKRKNKFGGCNSDARSPYQSGISNQRPLGGSILKSPPKLKLTPHVYLIEVDLGQDDDIMSGCDSGEEWQPPGADRKSSTKEGIHTEEKQVLGNDFHVKCSPSSSVRNFINNVNNCKNQLSTNGSGKEQSNKGDFFSSLPDSLPDLETSSSAPCLTTIIDK